MDGPNTSYRKTVNGTKKGVNVYPLRVTHYVMSPVYLGPYQKLKAMDLARCKPWQERAQSELIGTR